MREADGNLDASPDKEPLGRNRDFRLLVFSQGISSVGDMVAVTALPLLILELTGSGVALGVVFAIQAITDFGVSTFAGAIIDRADRKRIMVGADVGRAILTALIPLSVVLGLPTMAVIVLVAAPLRTFHAFFRAAYIASLPAIVGRGHLPRANGIVETVESTALIVGPAIAGLLAAAIGYGLKLAIDAASFAAAAVGLVLSIVTFGRPPAGPRPGSSTTCARGSSSSCTIRCCGRPSSCSAPSGPSSHRSFPRSRCGSRATSPSRRACSDWCSRRTASARSSGRWSSPASVAERGSSSPCSPGSSRWVWY